MTTIHTAIDSLNQAFTEFKSTNDDRLTQLEKKGSVDVLLDQKLSRLNETMTQTTDRLTKLEVAGQRPFLGEGDNLCAHKSAFLGYMRKGETHELTVYEKKSLSSINEASGGYLIPRTMLDKIHGHMDVISPMRALSRISTISTDAYELLIEKGEADAGWVG